MKLMIIERALDDFKYTLCRLSQKSSESPTDFEKKERSKPVSLYKSRIVYGNSIMDNLFDCD